MAWFNKNELEDNFNKQMGELDTEAKLVGAIEQVIQQSRKLEDDIAKSGFPDAHNPHPRDADMRDFLNNKLTELINRLAKEHNKEHKLVKKYCALLRK